MYSSCPHPLPTYLRYISTLWNFFLHFFYTVLGLNILIFKNTTKKPHPEITAKDKSDILETDLNWRNFSVYFLEYVAKVNKTQTIALLFLCDVTVEVNHLFLWLSQVCSRFVTTRHAWLEQCIRQRFDKTLKAMNYLGFKRLHAVLTIRQKRFP